MKVEYIILFIAGFFLGFLVCGLIFGLIGNLEPTDKYISINQETANDLCSKFLNNQTAIAKDWWNYEFGKEPIEKGQISCKLIKDKKYGNVLT